jgi:hypothetical protein
LLKDRRETNDFTPDSKANGTSEGEVWGEKQKSTGKHYNFFHGVFPAFPLLLFFSFFTYSSGFWYSENSKPHIRGLVADGGQWVLFIWTQRKAVGRV